MKSKKILCIVDSHEWALANRARALKAYFKNHNFDIKHFNEVKRVNFNSYDIVYSLNWPIHGYINKKITKKRNYRLITSVSSHIGQPRDHTFKNLLSNYDAVSLSNKMLHNHFYKRFPEIKIFYTPFGVDKKVFYPTTRASTMSNVFGWVGNDTRQVKRFDQIEAIFDDLNIDGVELKTVTQCSGFSRKEMAEFYNTVGTVICYSESEGTPNPILEAAACGRSIISSKVGNVPELVRGNKSIQIVSNAHQLRRAIERNIKSPHLLDAEGKFLKTKVDQYWNWDLRAKDFKVFLGL